MATSWPTVLVATQPGPEQVAYLGPAWAARALWVVQHDTRVRTAVAGSSVSLLVHIENGPPGRAKYLFVRFHEGQLAEHYIGDGHGSPSIPEPDFELRGEYATFASVQRGELDGRKALLSGRLKLHGSMLRAMGHLGALEALVEALSRIPSQT